MKILDTLIFYLGLSVVIFFLFIIIKVVFLIIIDKLNKKIIRDIVTFLVIVMIMIISIDIFEKNMRKEIVEKINEFEIEKAEVFINGEKVENSELYLEEFKKIHTIPAHHSSPKEKVKLEIISKTKTLTLEIRRDSQMKNEHWIFLPEYDYLSSNELGKIKTKNVNFF